MHDIHHDLPISATTETVFEAISSPEGLNSWWTLKSSGTPGLGAEYALYFGPDYDWRVEVRDWEPDRVVEWEFTLADPDWKGSRLRLELEEKNGKTWLHFSHSGWPENNDHYRISSYCWAMYLRLLRRYVEHGEVVPYEKRLDV